jgi:hypothetical protein
VCEFQAYACEFQAYVCEFQANLLLSYCCRDGKLVKQAGGVGESKQV